MSEIPNDTNTITNDASSNGTNMRHRANTPTPNSNYSRSGAPSLEAGAVAFFCVLLTVRFEATSGVSFRITPFVSNNPVLFPSSSTATKRENTHEFGISWISDGNVGTPCE